jgi:hypothetical protein
MSTKMFLYGGPLDGAFEEFDDNDYGRDGVFKIVGEHFHTYRTVNEFRFRSGSAIRVAVHNDILRADEQRKDPTDE